MAAGTIPGGYFERVAKRDQVPLKTIWEDEDKLPGEKNEWHNQVYNVNAIADYGLAKIKRDNGAVIAEQWNEQADPTLKIEKNRDLIEQHIDRRIQLFFMQLICCYKTPYHFTWIEANDEYGKGSKVTIKSPNGRGTQKIETEAAHSGTFPCLIAHPRAEWVAGNRGNGFVYLKYGRSYMNNNATIEFDRYMNRADCLIDGTSVNKLLREEAIKIVNAVAEGRKSVRKGMLDFMGLLELFCDQKRNVSGPRGLILDVYLERVRDVKAMMHADPGYFDQLLGVKVGEHEKEALLRKIVYQKRFKLIQDCEAIESQIARSILDSQNQILGKQNKSLKSVDTRLRYVLLEEVNPIFKRTMERLFCTSLEQLQADIEKNEQRLRQYETTNRIASFRRDYHGQIENLKRDLREKFRTLESLEMSYRSELFKGLRVELNNWTQIEFVRNFFKKYPAEAMSQTMVSRLEERTRPFDPNRQYKSSLSHRRKDITEAKGRLIADTFGVDAGLFLPGVISSVY